MQKLKNKPRALLAALALTMMSLTGCASGLNVSSSVKATPSPSFLRQVAHEYKTDTHGPATKEVVKDWIAQNEQ